MIWMRREAKKRLRADERKKAGWHDWFAWHPVWAMHAGEEPHHVIHNKEGGSYDYSAWLCTVERKWNPRCGGFWDHRIKAKEKADAVHQTGS